MTGPFCFWFRVETLSIERLGIEAAVPIHRAPVLASGETSNPSDWNLHVLGIAF
jgi:hypothetical protein